MLEWLGFQTATEFDPARFDADEVNRALDAGEDMRSSSAHSLEDRRAAVARQTA